MKIRRSSFVALLALFCLIGQLWSIVFTPSCTSSVEFLDYNCAFQTGETVLTVISSDGRVKELPAYIEITPDRKFYVSWKGNLPPGIVCLERNSKNASRLPAWIASTESAIIRLIDVADADRKEKDEPQVVYVVLTLGYYEVTNSRQKKVALVDLQYLYGVKKIYLNCSLFSVAARLLEMGHQATLVDFNLDQYDDPHVQGTFAGSDIIGVSLLGAPYIPVAIEFAKRVQNDFPDKTVAVGGQVIENISRDAFGTLFANSANVKQIVDDNDFADLIGEEVGNIPHPLEVSHRQVWEQMDPARLCEYLSHEMTLEVSQGCRYNCKFCAARKGQKEQMKNLVVFEDDLRFLAQQARASGIETLKFYASALDFFQSPESIGRMLLALAHVQGEEGIQIKVRCLTSMSTFLHARDVLNSLVQGGQDEFRGFSDFSELLSQAGLYCIGFGVDGSDESVWQRENKRHNQPHQVQECISLCKDMGIRTELLMVLGFPEDTTRILWKNFKNSVRYVFESKYVVLRPYLAKTFVPGNEGWTSEIEAIMVADPQKFYNIDYCAIGSPLTHPNRWNRWMSNGTYLTIIGLFYPFGRCDALPLLPQGEKGAYGAIAKFVNRIMPSDR